MNYAVIYTEKSSHRYRTNAHLDIYEEIMKLTDDNHEISSEVASWCELATIGEEREFDGYGFSVVIEDI